MDAGHRKSNAIQIKRKLHYSRIHLHGAGKQRELEAQRRELEGARQALNQRAWPTGPVRLWGGGEREVRTGRHPARDHMPGIEPMTPTTACTGLSKEQADLGKAEGAVQHARAHADTLPPLLSEQRERAAEEAQVLHDRAAELTAAEQSQQARLRALQRARQLYADRLGLAFHQGARGGPGAGVSRVPGRWGQAELPMHSRRTAVGLPDRFRRARQTAVVARARRLSPRACRARRCVGVAVPHHPHADPVAPAPHCTVSLQSPGRNCGSCSRKLTPPALVGSLHSLCGFRAIASTKAWSQCVCVCVFERGMGRGTGSSARSGRCGGRSVREARSCVPRQAARIACVALGPLRFPLKRLLSLPRAQ